MTAARAALDPAASPRRAIGDYTDMVGGGLHGAGGEGGLAMTSDDKTMVEPEGAPVEGVEEAAGPPEAEEPDRPDDAKSRRWKWKWPDAYGWWALGLLIGSAAVTVAALLVFPDDGMVYFRTGAVMGAALGLVGAILRVRAHDIGDGKGNRKLDLLGKVIAVYAAIFAVMFAVALLTIQITVPTAPGN